MSKSVKLSNNSGANQTVLVTGGTGYIGGWAILALLRQGYQVRTTVRALDRAPLLRAALAKHSDAVDRLAFHAADLLHDTGWAQAVEGCDYVLHIASPLGTNEAVIPAAREGTLRVLRASVQAGVQRVVVTSSGVAALPSRNPNAPTYGQPINEDIWTDVNDKQVDRYTRSKTLAERAAWDFMDANGGNTTLATVLPTAVLGPVLGREFISASVGIVAQLLSGKLPATPRLGLVFVDIRDVVELHLKAMTAPEAAGQRLLAGSEFLWLAQMAELLRHQFGSRAAKVPTRQFPDTLLRLIAPFSPTVQVMIPRLGQRQTFTSQKATHMLDWHARPVEQTVIDCAESLIGEGLV